MIALVSERLAEKALEVNAKHVCSCNTAEGWLVHNGFDLRCSHIGYISPLSLALSCKGRGGGLD
jgi:hypothetical protein